VAVEQRQNLNAVVQPERVIEGVSRPLWIDDRLILARRVKVGDKTLIQGCWLDWERLRGELLGAIADLTPEATLKPVTALEPQSLSRVLATLPVQLSVPPPTIAAAPRSSMRLALILAWTCLVAAAVAAAVMLWSVVALSERRGAFVAAVTHELRTPLTTFRMYAEMLADGMVPDAEQRQRYLETLRAEADRLAHLVDNVLQYARLERTNPDRRREKLPLGDLIDRMRGRLTSRTHEAGMVLKVAIDDATAETTVDLDVAAVEQIVFNLVDNACKYAAHAGDRRIHLEVVAEGRQAVIRVRDHGPGISRLGRRKLFQPFSKSVHEAANSAPGVGLGLALCRRLARHLGGRLTLAESNEGAVFELRLPL
jgi:signal transduction histidine kinase